MLTIAYDTILYSDVSPSSTLYDSLLVSVKTKDLCETHRESGQSLSASDSCILYFCLPWPSVFDVDISFDFFPFQIILFWQNRLMNVNNVQFHIRNLNWLIHKNGNVLKIRLSAFPNALHMKMCTFRSLKFLLSVTHSTRNLRTHTTRKMKAQKKKRV